MFLSQLLFNPRSRAARSDLADRYELHRTLLNAFPTKLSADERVLYRVEDNRRLPAVSVLVQSHSLPDWDSVERMQHDGYLADIPKVRTIMPNITQGQRIPFRLQANPTIKREGKRHAIYADSDLMEWLLRQGDRHGFTCDPLGVQMVKLGKKHGQKRRQTWHAVQFDGLLMVTNEEAFHAGLASGIGSAKGFGFGLLSIPYRSI